MSETLNYMQINHLLKTHMRELKTELLDEMRDALQDIVEDEFSEIEDTLLEAIDDKLSDFLESIRDDLRDTIYRDVAKQLQSSINTEITKKMMERENYKTKRMFIAEPKTQEKTQAKLIDDFIQKITKP